MASPVIPLISLHAKTTFIKIFVSERSFQRCVIRRALALEILKLPPSKPLGEPRGRQFSYLQIDLKKKTVNKYFFHFVIQGVFLDIFGRLNLFVTPGIHIFFLLWLFFFMKKINN